MHLLQDTESLFSNKLPIYSALVIECLNTKVTYYVAEYIFMLLQENVVRTTRKWNLFLFYFLLEAQYYLTHFHLSLFCTAHKDASHVSGKKANNPQIISRLGTGYRNWILRSARHQFHPLHNLIHYKRMDTSLFNPVH